MSQKTAADRWPVGKLFIVGCAAALTVAVLLSGGGRAEARDALTSGRLHIQGTRLTLYADEDTNDADQVLDIGETTTVRTCFGGFDDLCGTITAGDPRVAGLAVLAELEGPELVQAVKLRTVPGGSFQIPGFQQEGDYRLTNIRLVDGGSGAVIGYAEPAVAQLQVRRIVLTSATVETLTLADLRARGIELTQDSFQAFRFAVGFAIGTETVVIDLPVLLNDNGSVQALDNPQIALDGLPEDVARTVARWQPPQIVPFALEPTEEALLLDRQEEIDEQLSIPMMGALVVPGTVAYLNQFFDARLIVANGASAGSAVEIANVEAALRLPRGNGLRLARTSPPVSAGQGVPVVAEDGHSSLAAGEQGSAVWTVEGLRAGTHVLEMGLTGAIRRPGREPYPVASRTQAAVDVVDARFNLTFSHPDVVREGEPYSLFVTVTNLSPAAQNVVSVEIRDEHLVGAHALDPDDDMMRTLETLGPGQAETLEYQLVADVTGSVVAGTFQSGSVSGQGQILLRTGVGELGIPLSPATLVMPRFSERWAPPFVASDDFLRSTIRLLGLAYSLAVAPAGVAPEGLPRVMRADVERRAVDLGEAGQRTFLGEEVLESLEVLLLEQLGARHPLDAYDALRRRTAKGREAAAVAAALLRDEQAGRGYGVVDLLDHLAATGAYLGPFLAAVVEPVDGEAPVLEIRRVDGGTEGYLAYPAGHPEALRSLPYGEVFEVLAMPSGFETAAFALVGRVEPEIDYHVLLHNPGGSPVSGRLVVVAPDGVDGELRRIDLGIVEMAPSEVLGFTVSGARTDAELELVQWFTGNPVSGAPQPQVAPIAMPPFRLIGAVQDFRLGERRPDSRGNVDRPNRYGNSLAYLFNRPPDPQTVDDPTAFGIHSSFDGLDVGGSPASGVADAAALSVAVQPSERVVMVRYDRPPSPLLNPAGDPLVSHEHLVDVAAIRDLYGESMDPVLPDPVLEADPVHTGGLVEGRVVAGTGDGIAGVRVDLIRPREVFSTTGTAVVLDRVAFATTDAAGAFFFDFVEAPHWDRRVQEQFTLRATVPAGADPAFASEQVQEVGSVIRHNGRLTRLNIALLGRGSVAGRLLWADDEQPVAGGTVVAASTLFDEILSASVDAWGTWSLDGVPVGPITLTGSDPDGRRVYATVGIEQPGAFVEIDLHIPRERPRGVGSLTVHVVRHVAGETTDNAVSGAKVTVRADGYPVGERVTDEFGNARFEAVPEGVVSVQAADWRLSRTSVVSDLILAAEENRVVTIGLPVSEPRSVVGQVLFHDPMTNDDIPVEAALAFIPGPGVHARTGADGFYRIENVPVQGVTEGSYRLTVIDTARQLQGHVLLPPILDVSEEEEILAQPILLQEMRGGIDGVVLDPLGRPFAGAEVVLYPYGVATSGQDGGFTFDDVPLGPWDLSAHVGDGLTPGQVGFIGGAATKIVFGGHRPFVPIRMRGSGIVRLLTRKAASGRVQTPVYYKPTYFSEAEQLIRRRGSYLETTTDPLGELTLEVPVGSVELAAMHPFHGVREVATTISYPGQIRNVEIVFKELATITGVVVDVDGITPVPDAEVKLRDSMLQPRTVITDGQGGFTFDLVPVGSVRLSAEALVGSVERVGLTTSRVMSPGQQLNLQVRLKAQGSVRGCVREQAGGGTIPIPYAGYFVRESGFPNRRLPEGSGWYAADFEGCFEVSHLHAGRVNVVARDPENLDRLGRTSGQIVVDWEVVELEDVVLTTDVGSVELTVRDPEGGGPVADSQVKLDTGEATVTDAEGHAVSDAISVGSHSVSAFHAPTGRSARGWFEIQTPGERVEKTLYLDQRGEVNGTLFDDATKIVTVGAGVVELKGMTSGGRLQALATTSSQTEDHGRFELVGIPEGSFHLSAGVPHSARAASAEVEVTDTSPIQQIDLVLEPVADVFVRLYERRAAGLFEVDPASGLFAVRVQQGDAYDFTRSLPPVPGEPLHFPGVLTNRSADVSVSELDGERRRMSYRGGLGASSALDGSGTPSEPFRLVLEPKGTVQVLVQDGTGQPVASAPVTLRSGNGLTFPSMTGGDGRAVFAAVPAGALVATASSPSTGLGGLSRGTLTYDDDVIVLVVDLEVAVSAAGVVYQPLPGDCDPGDPGLRIPQEGALVTLTDSRGDAQLMVTGSDGLYSFDGLHIGGCLVEARDQSGAAVGSVSGSLSGPGGHLTSLPDLLLDASLPRVVSITPSPGAEDVSRTAAVTIVFSELLLTGVVPTGQAASPFFRLRSSAGTDAVGLWSSGTDAGCRQVVRFEPGEPYDNLTLYSLTLTSGPGGIRDRVGRPLTTSGPVGSSFRTSDSIGPKVLGTDPGFNRPVDDTRPIRVDLNEAVNAVDGVLDDEIVLRWQRDDGGSTSWHELPVTLSTTRGGYSILVDPVDGLVLQDDTLRREVTVDQLEDSQGNQMTEAWVADFRIRDDNPPIVADVPCPAGSVCSDLRQGTSYTLVPVLDGLDDVTPETPYGDADRIAYFLEDPATGGSAVYESAQPPFAYPFIAVYTGNGVDPRPFSVWAQAVDTSENLSEVVRVEMAVMPNVAPAVASVTLAATSPVSGVAYAGSNLWVGAYGVADADGAQVTVNTELWISGETTPLSVGAARLISRPASGDWNDLGPIGFTFVLPIDIPEGTEVLARAHVVDAFGASASVDSELTPVADDQVSPTVQSVLIRSVDTGETVSRLHIGDDFVVEIRAVDSETAVSSVEVLFDQLFPSPSVATPVPGASGLYQTQILTVPTGLPPEGQAITTTAQAHDYGGNTGAADLQFEVAPDPDPTAPTVEWKTPWEGAPWPADHSSVVSPDGTSLLLRVRVEDTSQDGDGNPIPGEIAEVEFRCPEPDGSSGWKLEDTSRSGVVVAGSEAPGTADYHCVCILPNGIAAGTVIPFEAVAVDTGDLGVTSVVRVTARSARLVYEAVPGLAVMPDDPMVSPGKNPSGLVFLLDGTTLSLIPDDDGVIRSLPGVVLYAGGREDGGDLTVRPSVLTAPEVTSYSASTLFHPLEVAVTHELIVGSSCALDMNGRGLLGGTANDSVVLPGEHGAEPLAGGSHGGRGWYGSPDRGWDELALTSPGSSYGSVRDPALPGGGGRSDGVLAVGGAGGGVIRIHGATAVVRLAGRISADGSNGVEYGSEEAGGGAGGSILFHAAQLEGDGVITADGGTATHVEEAGGGGGGRVAVFTQTTGAGFDPVIQISAKGGGNGGGPSGRLAGAGTVYFEMTDPTVGPTGVGTLTVDNLPDLGRPAAVTRLPSIGSTEILSVDPAGSSVVVAEPSLHGTVVGDRLVVEDGAGGEVDVVLIVGQERVIHDGQSRVQLTLSAAQAQLDNLTTRLASGPVPVHGRTRFETVRVAGAARLTTDDDLEIGPPSDLDPALNERAALNLDDVARVLLRGEFPEITVSSVTPETGSDIRLGSSVSAVWSAVDPLGLARFDIEWSADETAESFRYANEATTQAEVSEVRTVPVSAAAGDVSLSLQVTNLDGRVTTESLTWNLLENEPPEVILGLAAGAPAAVQAGLATTVAVHVEDPEGLAGLELVATGPVTQTSQIVALEGSTADLELAVAVLPDATGGVPVVLQAVVTDIVGAVVASEVLEIPVLPDTNSPSVEIGLNPPSGGQPYPAGTLVIIAVTAADDVAVENLALSIDGALVTSGASPLTYQWIAPAVEEDVDFVVSAEAVDPSGNSGSASVTVSVTSLDDPNRPAVRFSCPTEAAILPTAHDVVLHAVATDDVGVQKVEFFLEGTVEPFDTVVAGTGAEMTFAADSQPFTLPTSPELVTFRSRVYDWAGGFDDATTTVEVVETVDLSTDEAANDWTALESQIAVLRSGTLTLSERHLLDGLILLPGAALTHPEYDVGTREAVDLEIGSSAYVSCGASVFVGIRGYLSGETYPGEISPGTYSGGSHFGIGGAPDGEAGSVYGSVCQPREAGSGGGGVNGHRGAGVVRLQVADDLVLDGWIGARGSGSLPNRPSAAGGSIWLSVGGELTGSGSLDASGGDSTRVDLGSGGGGAIVIEAGSLAEKIRSRSRATGGGTHFVAGAGTIVVRDLNDSTYGDLLVDNGGTSDGVTHLPGLGSGIAQAASSMDTLITDRTSIQPYFVGHWIRVTTPDGQLRGTWRTEELDGGVVTLEDGATVDPGDLWRGVYRFDSVTLRGGAQLEVGDLDEFGSVDVAPGSSIDLVNHGGPVVDPALVGIDAVEGSFVVSGAPGAVADGDGVATAQVVNTVTGAAVALSVGASGEFPPVVITGSVGDGVRIDATDAHDDPLSSQTPVAALPVNADEPVITVSLISFGTNGVGAYRLVGAAGAISDANPGFDVVATNTTSIASWTGTGASDGSFVVDGIAGDFQDPFTLTVTDRHPQPRTAGADVGPMPDLVVPVINDDSVQISVHDGAFWVFGDPGAVVDDNEGTVLSVADPVGSVSVAVDGSFAELTVSTTIGGSVTLTALDIAGNSATAEVGPFPANDGPPVLDQTYVWTASDFVYTVRGAWVCYDTPPCFYSLTSPDGLTVTLENRTTPGFGPYESALQTDGTGGYWFDAVEVGGVVGDEIWLVAADGHPDPQFTETMVWNLPVIDDAPSVDLDASSLVTTVGGTHRIVVESGDVTGDPGPLDLTARVFRGDTGAWVEVTAETTGLVSGEAVDIDLEGTAAGDLVVATVSDASAVPRSTSVRVGTLPSLVVPEASVVFEVLSAAEDAGAVAVDVALSVPPTQPVWVRLTPVGLTADAGSDFDATTRDVVFGVGQTARSVAVPVFADSAIEGDETFRLDLSVLENALLGIPSAATVTIIDVVPLTVSMAAPSASVAEDAGAVELGIVLSRTSDAPVVVRVNPIGVTAVEGLDFDSSPVDVTIDSGLTTAVAPIPVFSDIEDEGDETFRADLEIISGADPGALLETDVTIIDVVPEVTIEPALASFDLAGCEPLLVAAAGTVVSATDTVNVQARIDNPDPASDYWTQEITISSGAGFSIPLTSAEPGAEIRLAAGVLALSRVTMQSAPDAVHAQDLDPVEVVVGTLTASAPVVLPAGTSIEYEFGTADVTIPIGTIEERLGGLTLALHNLTSGSSIAVNDPCVGDPSIGSITAEVGDVLALEACHGSVIQVCTDPPVEIGTVGFQRLDVGLGTVTGMWRSGPTVVVSGIGSGPEARVISLDDPWAPDILSWSIPLVADDVRGVLSRRETGVTFVDGSHVVTWDQTGGVLEDIEPLGVGIRIDAILVIDNHAFFVGASGAGTLVGVSVLDGAGGLACLPNVVPVSSETDPLAVVPLPHGQVGIVLADTAVRVDVADPRLPLVVVGTTLDLAETSSPVAAVLEDDHLVVWDGADEARSYRLPATGRVSTSPTDPITLDVALGIGPDAGRLPNAMTRVGMWQVVGWDNGDVSVMDLGGESRSLGLPGGAVLDLTETHGTLLAATPDGVYRILLTDDEGAAEIDRTAFRFVDRRASIAAGGMGFGPDGAELWFTGEDPDEEWAEYIEYVSDPWAPFFTEIPLVVDGVTDVEWYELYLYDATSAMPGDFIDLGWVVDTGSGPRHLDPLCVGVENACDGDLVAAGAGWRAWAATGADQVHLRMVDGGSWSSSTISATDVRSLVAGGIDESLLFVGGDALTVVDLAEPLTPGIASVVPHAAGCGPVLETDEMTVVSSSDGLEVAVVDVSDPATPMVVTSAMQIDDGVGLIRDLYGDPSDRLWLLASAPDRLFQLDGAVLPSVQVAGSISLDVSTDAVALDGGALDSSPVGGGIHGLWIVRRGGGVQLVDAGNTGAGAVSTVELPGDPRDVLVVENNGASRILVAAGRDAGVLEVGWDSDTGDWKWSWVADLGDVRALTLVREPFQPGTTAPEGCADMGLVNSQSTVGDPCSAQAYALTETGVLPVAVDVCDPAAGS